MGCRMTVRIGRSLSLLVALAGCQPKGAANSPNDQSPRYDLIITGGRIVDGSGNPWYYGDLAVEGDKIARITPPGRLEQATAEQRIDARGMVVSPGFIDIQAQSVEAFTMGDGRVVSMVTQGITTAIMGEGDSPAPINDKILAALPDKSYAAKIPEKMKGPHGFAGWLETMEAHGISQNAGSFLGAGTVRVYAKGEAIGAASPAELDTMRTVVRNAMEDGAFGVGSALIYPPGNFASTEELIVLAKAMAPYGGVYISHMRSESDRLLEAIDEAMRIGKEGGVPVEIFHFKAEGSRNWPKFPAAIAKIDSARAAGADVGADMYLYTAGGTSLAACAPPWAAADGKLLANLADPTQRAKIRDAMLHPTPEWENLCEIATPAGVQLSGFKKPENKKWEGKRLAEIAAAEKKDWWETWAGLVASEPVGMIVHHLTESNLPLALRQPWVKIGTDAAGVDPDSMAGAKVHPRTYGDYPRLLGRYVRELKVISLEEAIRKSSSAVANRLSIRDRGRLHEGAYADIVIFDPATIIDRATFEDPNQLSVGVRDVWVNGVAVVANGKHTGAKPGRALRGPGAKVTAARR
jgi:dihydroorotase/N-acyl-D-amino-acid deacylase